MLKKLVNNGHRLILYTMRSGKELEDAVNWFKERDIPLYGVNENPDQGRWTTSKKVFAHIYIDDSALGCPLIHFYDTWHVDWVKIEEILVKNGYISG